MRSPLKQAAHVAYEVGFYIASLASRIANAVIYSGSMHQTLSARAFIEAFTDQRWDRRMKRIDRLFFMLSFGKQKYHCAQAWASEVGRARKTLKRNGDMS